MKKLFNVLALALVFVFAFSAVAFADMQTNHKNEAYFVYVCEDIGCDRNHNFLELTMLSLGFDDIDEFVKFIETVGYINITHLFETQLSGTSEAMFAPFCVPIGAMTCCWQMNIIVRLQHFPSVTGGTPVGWVIGCTSCGTVWGVEGIVRDPNNWWISWYACICYRVDFRGWNMNSF